jgi:uncharacterized membrane protein
LEGGEAVSFFDFDSFITPTLIKIVFYLGIAASVLGYVISVFTAVITQGLSSAVVPLFGGGVMLVIGVLLWRVYCELAIVVFRMFKELQRIRRSVEPGDNRAAEEVAKEF